MRGNTRAVPPALSLIRSLEMGGTRVLNGSRAFLLELSKSAQAGLLRILEIPHPRSLALNDLESALVQWAGSWPALLSQNKGAAGRECFC
jgi:glutathione synthase/RimK-type ligase-like ATP-grasp enzyme